VHGGVSCVSLYQGHFCWGKAELAKLPGGACISRFIELAVCCVLVGVRKLGVLRKQAWVRSGYLHLRF